MCVSTLELEYVAKIDNIVHISITNGGDCHIRPVATRFGVVRFIVRAQACYS